MQVVNVIITEQVNNYLRCAMNKIVINTIYCRGFITKPKVFIKFVPRLLHFFLFIYSIFFVILQWISITVVQICIL